jgi:mono/diheme cytochrome c family protein
MPLPTRLARTASASLLCLVAATTLPAQDKGGGNPMDLDPPPNVVVPPAPHLTVPEALAAFEIEKGFAVAPLISEPNIVDPVAMAIDEDGRLFVAEMRGYMIDTDGKGEDQPTGRISVHEDPDASGVYQKHAVFVDNIVLPRALSFCAKGLLFADQNSLYVVGRAGAKAVGAPQAIDPAYAGNGNVEHRASGCLLALDNWYYSANCGFRYRYRSGRWERDITEAHGQWGITQDDYGRLMTNNNSLAMSGDTLPPTDSLRNPAFKWKSKNNYQAPDNLVYPIRVNPGCNRAYIRSGGKDGGFHQEVGDDWKLRQYTAGCAPWIYRGGAFGAANDSIFVPEPSGNLVMRYKFTHEDSGAAQVSHVNPGHSFLASTDERFRPVYCYTGPAGELYIVDMHKGILQHKAYMTPYLKRQVKERHLEDESPAGYGRIWRITTSPAAAGAAAARPAMSGQSSPEVMAYLASPNAWWRETAQRVLIERGGQTMISPLATMAASSDNPLARVHALWTLEGLGGLTVPMLEAAAKSTTPRVVAEAIRLAEEFAGTPQAEAAGALVKTLLAAAKSPIVQTQAALSCGPLAVGGSASAWAVVTELGTRAGSDPVIRDALVSGLGGGETEAVKRLESGGDAKLVAELKQTAATRAGMKPEALSRAPKTMLLLNAAESAKQTKANAMPPGQAKFAEICAVCHSPDGKGLFGLGPPLAGSEWVTGEKKTPISIVLLGLGGPITVAGKAYKQPEVGPLMPGLSYNLTDTEIAGVLTYIRSAFGNTAGAVTAADVAEERKLLGARGNPFTPEELSGTAPAK